MIKLAFRSVAVPGRFCSESSVPSPSFAGLSTVAEFWLLLGGFSTSPFLFSRDVFLDADSCEFFREGSFSWELFLEGGAASWEVLREAGFSCELLRDCGFSAETLRELDSSESLRDSLELLREDESRSLFVTAAVAFRFARSAVAERSSTLPWREDRRDDDWPLVVFFGDVGKLPRLVFKIRSWVKLTVKKIQWKIYILGKKLLRSLRYLCYSDSIFIT